MTQSSESAETGTRATIAGSAIFAGLAGGYFLASRFGRSSTAETLGDAAKQIGRFGDQVGELAIEARHMRQGIEAGADRSPIEVVLQALTRR